MPSSADSSSRIRPLPVGTDLDQLAEAWSWACLRLDERTRERAMNAALGLPDWAHQGERSLVVHGRRWAEHELCARFELARRELGPPSGRQPIAPLPVGADLAQLAEAWESSRWLDARAHDRVMNLALGLPEDAHQGERSLVVHGQRWAEDELCARFELARRELGLERPRPPRWGWSSWPVRWRRRFRALFGR